MAGMISQPGFAIRYGYAGPLRRRRKHNIVHEYQTSHAAAGRPHARAIHAPPLAKKALAGAPGDAWNRATGEPHRGFPRGTGGESGRGVAPDSPPVPQARCRRWLDSRHRLAHQQGLFLPMAAHESVLA